MDHAALVETPDVVLNKLTSRMCVEKPICDISMWKELWLEPNVPGGERRGGVKG